MPLSNPLKSAAGTCPLCHQKAGVLSREHRECRWAHQADWQEMVQFAALGRGIPGPNARRAPQSTEKCIRGTSSET